MIVLRHFYKLCSRARLLYFLDVFFRFLVIGVFILIILMIVGAGVLAQIVLAAVLLIWLIVAFSRSSYFGYEFMNGGLIIQCGTFSCRQDTVPYHKI